MAKVQSFADKAAKFQKRDAEITCPKCGKNTKVIYAKVVNSVKTEKNTWKFLEKNSKVCGNCLQQI